MSLPQRGAWGPVYSSLPVLCTTLACLWLCALNRTIAQRVLPMLAFSSLHTGSMLCSAVQENRARTQVVASDVMLDAMHNLGL